MSDIHQICAAAYKVDVDGDGFVFADGNEACLALTGIVAAFRPGLRPHDVFPPSVADEIVCRYRACVDFRQAVSHVSEMSTPNGVSTWRTTLFPLSDSAGRVRSIIGVLCETSSEEASGKHLSLNDRASMAIDAIDGGFWIHEIADDTFETSRSLAELLAGPGHRTLNLVEYVSFIHSEDFATAKRHSGESDRSEVEYRVITFDGRTLWLRSKRRTLRDANGLPVRIVGHVTDVTQQKKAFDALWTEASTDALTSIRNRRAFDRFAADAFRERAISGRPVGILLIDLDGFKPINDRYGHRTGDEILRKVARRIGRFVRKSACFARIGGDEFAILLRGSSAMTGEALALRIQEAFSKPFSLDSEAVYVGISTGFGAASAEDATIADVIDRADRALYAMKRSGRLKSA